MHSPAPWLREGGPHAGTSASGDLAQEMTESEFALLFAVEAACGAAGGVAASRWTKAGVSRAASMFAGAFGGVLLAWLTGFVPSLARFVGYVETAGDATLRATGGLTPGMLVGAGIAGLLGGTLLAGVVGLVSQRAAKRL